MGRRSVVALSRLLVLPLVAASCATTSTLDSRAGGGVEARILGGSPTSVYLGVDRARFTMRREDIADVDYPGNLHVAGGLVLTAVGVGRLYTGDTSCATFGELGTCAANVGPVIAGLLAIGWGLYVNIRARRAFADRSKPEPDPVMPRRPTPEPPHLPGWRKPDPFADPR